MANKSNENTLCLSAVVKFGNYLASTTASCVNSPDECMYCIVCGHPRSDPCSHIPGEYSTVREKQNIEREIKLIKYANNIIDKCVEDDINVYHN